MRRGSWYVRRPAVGGRVNPDGSVTPVLGDLWFAGSWDDEVDYGAFRSWREAFDYAAARAETSGALDRCSHA